MKLVHATALCALALAAAGCGDDDEQSGGDRGEATRLEVVVRPDGDGGEPRRIEIGCDQLGSGPSDVCRRLAGLAPADLAPVPDDRACAEIYGGPAVATVEGTLRGEPVTARFDLTDACEIARWRRNRALLGKPPFPPCCGGHASTHTLRVRPPSTSSVTPVM
jgi:hypothetical protein